MHRLVNGVSRVSGRVVSWLFLLSVGGIFIEVVARYFFNAPTSWAFETSLYGGAIAIVVAGAYCTQNKSHIAITSLRDALPRGAQVWLDRVNTLVVVVVCFALAYGTAEWGWKALVTLQRTGSAWNPPAPAILKPLIPLTSFWMGLQAISNLVATFTSPDDEN